MTSSSIRIAAVQLSSGTDLDRNLSECRRLIARAAGMGCEAVVLPENFAFMGEEEQRRGLAEPLDAPQGPIARRLSEWASAHGITVVAGGMPEASDDPERPYNTAVVIDATGKIVARYRKVHLFDVDLPDGPSHRESQSTTPGTEPLVVAVDGHVLGLSICYDLRFPELYRALVALGAEALLVPAAFTMVTGKDHWHVLLRARAIESQCWVVAAAQWGAHPHGRTTYGHTMIVDPWGTIVAQASDGVGLVAHDLDRAYLARVRRALPSLSHRRL
jgi:predicted amidohydrolase